MGYRDCCRGSLGTFISVIIRFLWRQKRYIDGNIERVDARRDTVGRFPSSLAGLASRLRSRSDVFRLPSDPPFQSLRSSPLFFFPVQISTSNEGHSTARHVRAGNAYLHALPCVPAQRPLPSCCHVSARAPSNSERKSEQEAEILLRAGKRGMGKEMGGRAGRGRWRGRGGGRH